ncbi:ABC transporter permease [Desulfoluna butyratoxydans]|uniref:Binding-protein-dependent transport system inner membrane component n=1 Tax=Desulfoluna butyratoxydans TaxID=231438 RepID=A0A4U8YQ19_9BACT|nr:ABC transporter permease [Desulfoluna butyratoxydans]VFQ45537.1 binding-protein-dependent transport system inner membrane component [Desulfoluna butyratoxydans]
MTSIANETQSTAKERSPITVKTVLMNKWFLYAVSLTCFFGLWDYVAYKKILGSSLARPLEVVEYMGYMITHRLAGNSLWGHVWASTRRILIGFSIASLVAVPLGLMMALNKYVNAIVKPIFDLMKPMPPIAWISISILWFGIGEPSKVFIIIIGTFVPCLLNSYNGVRLVEPELYDVVRVLGGNRRDEILQVCFPAAFPSIFAGLQISLSIAWTCVLAAELVSARSGLGYVIIKGMNLGRPAMVLGGMVAIALAALLTSQLVGLLEKVLCPWKREIEGL